VAWPVVFATDSLWSGMLLPLAQPIEDGSWVPAVASLSIVPKAAGSYLGAHLHVPRAWWVYKLTLLPALPLSFGISMLIHFATMDGTARREAAEAYAGPEAAFTPPAADSSLAGSTQWQLSKANDKSHATRLREAAPSALQFLMRWAGL
jgi:hypothetical protein